MKNGDRIRTKADGLLGTLVGSYEERIWDRGVPRLIPWAIVVLDDQGWRTTKRFDEIEKVEESEWP